MDRLAHTVVHYSAEDPRTTTGGVQTFARNLQLLFERVEYMTPADRDVRRVVEAGLPVVCDNQTAVDWPDGYPVIAMQQGVGAVKYEATRKWTHRRLRAAQAKAAKRPDTIWVACARWISEAFGRLYGNRADHVIYHFPDLERFDGRLDNAGSRILLHDARLPHKGKAELEHLARVLDGWEVRALDCPRAEIPDMMRGSRAFLHLSRYEGNSLVCNEAMAMDLPGLYTRVGLFRDEGGPTEVAVVDPAAVFGDRDRLEREVRAFLATLETREYRPRAWVLANATRERSLEGWRVVMEDWRRRMEARGRRPAAA